MPKRKRNRKRVLKKQQGGILRGPSHAQGGIPAVVGGTTPVELEGGEYIIRRSSVAKYGEGTIARINQGLVDPAKLRQLKKGGRVNPNRKNPKKFMHGGMHNNCPPGQYMSGGVCVDSPSSGGGMGGGGYRKGGKIKSKKVKRFTHGGEMSTSSSESCPPGQYLLNGQCVPGSTGSDGTDMKRGGRVRKTKKRFQDGGEISLPVSSQTSNNAGHVHNFTIDISGNVTIYEAVHPQEPMIKHRHYYSGVWPNGFVTENQSDCYPNCESLYGYAGAPPHAHNISMTQQINNYRGGGSVKRGRRGQRKYQTGGTVTTTQGTNQVVSQGRFRFFNSGGIYTGRVIYRNGVPYTTKSGTYEGNSRPLERF
jgi:hypothetical protein